MGDGRLGRVRRRGMLKRGEWENGRLGKREEWEKGGRKGGGEGRVGGRRREEVKGWEEVEDGEEG